MATSSRSPFLPDPSPGKMVARQMNAFVSEPTSGHLVGSWTLEAGKCSLGKDLRPRDPEEGNEKLSLAEYFGLEYTLSHGGGRVPRQNAAPTGVATRNAGSQLMWCDVVGDDGDDDDGDGDQGSLVRGVAAIESDGLMAKDRTATYEMGLQRIRCREHVANFIFTLLLLLDIFMSILVITNKDKDKNKDKDILLGRAHPLANPGRQGR